MQAQQGLDVADDFAAGGVGLEQLPDEAFEGQAQGEDALAAVGAFLHSGEQGGGEEVPQVFLELGQGGLAEGWDGAAAPGGQAGAEGGQERRVHHRAVSIPPY